MLTPTQLTKVIALVRLRPDAWYDALAQVAVLSVAFPCATPAQRAKIRVAAEGEAGLLEARVARSTRMRVGIYDNRIAQIEGDEPTLRYMLVCDHGGCVGVETLRVARAEARHPEGWCDDCRDLGMEGASRYG